ncbi:CapA family protein [Staphylococcus sp. 18_1_E_LY]|uniref:CapA family protein n=1 Tax=Staphylococcus lloydii TaxID=2781774 RepID=A0A7T1AZI9_9STAP|nr:CapA family protein [Staphylococcus lloydii]MBF7019586.1 CapA family protein [Staphylococcus lloydii]MBF7027313.1 CapA family protein [Staphylococcus lloydii]QPM74981.1 CapA family protein [Staphylococcus lloydii]
MKKLLVVISTLIILAVIVVGFSLPKDSKNLKVVAVGDNLIHPVVYNDAKVGKNTFDFKPMYSHIKPYIHNSDVAYINQESPLGGDDIPYSGFKRFNTPSSISKDVIDTGFNLINGSNNHALDQGTEGLRNNIDVWKKYQTNALFTGVFDSKKERDKTPILNKKGTKISMLSYTFGTNGLKPDHPYQINYINKQNMSKDIAKAKKKSDVVMVSMHWGNEGSHQPNSKQKDIADFLAKKNVDVVIGMHPHVIQPVEWKKGTNGHKTLVAYSLGNFLNGQETGTTSNDLGGSIEFDIDKKENKNKIKNVKWRSIVNHYEIKDPSDLDTRHNFKLYMLDDYTDKLSNKHGRNHKKHGNMDKSRLEHITKDVIDNKYLDSKSY